MFIHMCVCSQGGGDSVVLGGSVSWGVSVLVGEASVQGISMWGSLSKGDSVLVGGGGGGLYLRISVSEGLCPVGSMWGRGSLSAALSGVSVTENPSYIDDSRWYASY